MARELTVEALLARIAQRDEGALAELYDRYAPRLLGLIQRILPKRSAAEEVLEDVFVRLWSEARHLGEARLSAEAWLALTARDAAVAQLRAERKLRAVEAGNLPRIRKSLGWLPRPEEIARLDERRELLRKVISQLPKPQRQALDLAVFEGYTEEEIAQKLGEPLGRVRTGLRAAMSFLRHRLRAVTGTWAANL